VVVAKGTGVDVECVSIVRVLCCIKKSENDLYGCTYKKNTIIWDRKMLLTFSDPTYAKISIKKKILMKNDIHKSLARQIDICKC